MSEHAAIIGEATGKPNVATYIPVQQFAIEFPFPGAHDMFEFYNAGEPLASVPRFLPSFLLHTVQKSWGGAWERG